MSEKLPSAISDLLRGADELEAYRSADGKIELNLAYDLSEILESMEKVLKEIWPKAVASQDVNIAGECLFEVREELRHILYHIENSAYFSIICG